MSQALAQAREILKTLQATDETKKLEELAATIEAKLYKQADTGSTPAASSSSSSSASSPSSSSPSANKPSQSQSPAKPSFLSGLSGLFGTSNKSSPSSSDEAAIKAAVSNLNPSDVAALANLATPENLARLVQPPSASSPAVVQKQDIPTLIDDLKGKPPKEQFAALKGLEFVIPSMPDNEAAKKEWDIIITKSNDVKKTKIALINGTKPMDDSNITNLKTGILELNGALEAFKYSGADQADGRDEKFRVYTKNIAKLENFITNSKPPRLFQAYEGYDNLQDSYEKVVIAAQSAKDIVISKDADQNNFTRDLTDFNTRYGKFLSQKLLYDNLMEGPIMQSITSGNLKKGLAQDQRTDTLSLNMSRAQDKKGFELNRKMQAIKDALKFNGTEYPSKEIDEYNTAMVNYNNRQGKKTPYFSSIKEIMDEMGKGKTPIIRKEAILKNINTRDETEREILKLEPAGKWSDEEKEKILNLYRQKTLGVTEIPKKPTKLGGDFFGKKAQMWEVKQFHKLYAAMIVNLYNAQSIIDKVKLSKQATIDAETAKTPPDAALITKLKAALKQVNETDGRKDKTFVQSVKDYQNAIRLYNSDNDSATQTVLTTAELRALKDAIKKGGKRTSRKNRKGKPSKRQSRRRPHKVQVVEA